MVSNLILAKTVDEAVKAKNEKAAYFAGGTEITRLNSYVEAETGISLKNIDGMKDITVDGDIVTVGAKVTFQEIVESDKVPAYLSKAALFMNARVKRNMATIGGNIASLRTDSYMIPTLIAAKAILTIADINGSKEITIRDYIENNVNYQDALILNVKLSNKRVVLSKRYSNTAQSLARVTEAMGYEDGKDYAIGACVINSGIFFVDELAKKIETNDGKISEEDALAYFADWKDAKIDSDFYGSEAYKRYLLGITISIMAERGENYEG